MEILKHGQLNSEALAEVLKGKTGAIFDMDGTLLDSMSMWHTLDIQYLRGFNLEPEPEFQQIVATMTLSVAAEYMCEHYHLPRTPKQVEDEFMELVENYYRVELQLKPGALDLVKGLREKGFSIMVATANEYDVTLAALERTGVVPYIDELVTCTMAGEGKESPAVYVMACDQMGKHISECVVFEDSLFAMKTAKKKGFSVVAVYDDAAEDCWDEICELTECQVVF